MDEQIPLYGTGRPVTVEDCRTSKNKPRGCRMAFSQDVINKAWKRAGGKCECTRRDCPEHIVVSCRRVLDPYNKRPGMKWEAHHKNAQKNLSSHDGASNCEILCVACHKKTQSYGV